MEKKCKKAKWLSGEALQIAVKKREAKSKGEKEKAGLKVNIQKTKIMASVLITSWQIHETMKTVTDFILGGSSITEDGDCSHEIKRHFRSLEEKL